MQVREVDPPEHSQLSLGGVRRHGREESQIADYEMDIQYFATADW